MPSVFNNVFVTVGTTEFDQLIAKIDEESSTFVDILTALSCQKLTIQIGRGIIEPRKLPGLCVAKGIQYECFRFKPTLSKDMESSDLVISHCGAGSILEALSLGKPLVVVVNETLQENHQSELAYELSANNHCIATVPSALLQDLQSCLRDDKLNNFIKYPEPDHTLFPEHVKGLFSWEPKLLAAKK